MLNRTHQYRRSAIAAIALLAALAIAGCGESQEVVCKGQPESIVIVPSTSLTDYDVSTEMTPEVSRQVVRRVAASCGRITVGVQDSQPEANLELRSQTLHSDEKKAYNPGAKTEKLIEKGEEFTEQHLIAPLNATEPTSGSPFLSALIKIGAEMETHDWPRETTVLVGDGLVVERPPEGGPLLHFGTDPLSAEDLAPFAPLLQPLKGTCVVLVGAGATSKAPDHMLRASQQLFGETLAQAGVGFVATRSPQVPSQC